MCELLTTPTLALGLLPHLVRVLDAERPGSAEVPRQEMVEEDSSQSPQMEVAGRGWGEAQVDARRGRGRGRGRGEAGVRRAQGERSTGPRRV